MTLRDELVEITRQQDPTSIGFWVERCAVLEQQRDDARDTAARYLQLLMADHKVMFEVQPGVPGVVLSERRGL